MTNSKQKGKRGELEAAKELRRIGFFGARRGQQYSGSPDSPDIADAIPDVHIEVKRGESFHLYQAMEQAVADAGAGKIPIVLNRRNRSKWIVHLHLEDLPDFADAVKQGLSHE